jgi:DNA primase
MWHETCRPKRRKSLISPDLSELKKHPRVLDLYKSRLRLQKQGSRYRGLCPFHADRTANNFDVFPSDGTYVFKCLSCGEAGSIIDLIKKTDSVDFRGALVIIKEFCSDRAVDKEKIGDTFGGAVTPKGKYQTIPLADYLRFEGALINSPAALNWLLQERGIDQTTALKLHLGFVQDIGNRAGPANPLADKGWVTFPSFDNNQIVDLKYRSIVNKAFCKQGGMAKGDDAVLHGLESIDIFEPIFVTEGELDRAALEQANFRSVSIGGANSKIPPAMIDRLLTAECVILAGDTDPVGSELMLKLWKEIKGNVYLLRWPSPHKDANEFFLSGCGRSVKKFQDEVSKLISAAKDKPMEGVYNIEQSLASAQHIRGVDHPDRFEMPWKKVQEMALILPGTVTAVYSTESGIGKTNWVIQATIHHARVRGETVLNYQAEMSPHQIDTMFASHIMQKNRIQLTEDDYRQAARTLGPNFKYYIGRNTSLTTIGEVLDLIEAAVKRFNAKVVVLDNLHFLARNEADQIKAQANAMQRITNMTATHGLKFILIHQARKADQNHKRKVTHISDMDGSKAVQNDSTTVFSLHREEVKHTKGDEAQENEYSPVLEIRLQKARDKGEGKAYAQLLFNGGICTFHDMMLSEAASLQTNDKEEILF